MNYTAVMLVVKFKYFVYESESGCGKNENGMQVSVHMSVDEQF